MVSSHKTSRENELTLCVGDIVKNIVMTGDKYWNGCLNGKWGSFPGECVELQTEGEPGILNYYIKRQSLIRS